MPTPLPLTVPLAFRLCLSLAWPGPGGGLVQGFSCPSEAPGPAPVLPSLTSPAIAPPPRPRKAS